MTDAERKLWQRLRQRQVLGLKFRSQAPFGKYVVDFACLEKRLIIEIDGKQHKDRIEYDVKRTAWLKSQGFDVLRFWNTDVLQNMEGVLERIVQIFTR
jgi:very-short-patch-repair endonuclease